MKTRSSRAAMRARRAAGVTATALALLLATVTAPVPVRAAHDHSMPTVALFVNAGAISRSGDLPASLARTEGDLGADLILGFKHRRLRFLGELFAENDELDPERLQVGVELGASTVLWAGRFHQPGSVWNIFYHHGAYLQTGISRPWIENWEDDEGVLAQHIDGLLLETQLTLRDQSAINVSVGVGRAPLFLDTGLRPFDQAGHQPRASENEHLSLRLQWMPDPIGEDMVGLVWSHTDLPVRRSDTLFGSDIQQDALGPFAAWNFGRHRLIASVLHTRLKAQSGLPLSSFTSGYAEFDYSLRARTMVYARAESLAGGSRSPYLQRFDASEPQRVLLGVRQELPHKNALKLEVGRLRSLSGDWHQSVAIQWSAAIP